MKFSIITAVYNRVEFISHAVKSVQEQTYGDIEHLIVDGASIDGTLDVISSCMNNHTFLFSEPDFGIYDALNKGLARATGEIIGLLHSDDFFADENVLLEISKLFLDPSIDAVYGDLDYVARDDVSKIIRHWRSSSYSPSLLARGWMPPHPTLFLRRGVIEKWGGFDTSFQISSDYDAMLRYFKYGRIRSAYIPRVLVKMRIGGESNRSITRILRKSHEDYIALNRNKVGGFRTLLFKNLSKLKQFI